MLTRFRRRGNLLGALLLATGVVLLFPGIVLRHEVIAQSDLLVFHYPMKTVIQRLFASGQSLLWNPCIGEGQPLAANPDSQLFYPFTWLVFVLPVGFSLTATLLCHLALGFAGSVRLLRRLRHSEIASLLGAALWTFGGLNISSLNLVPEFESWAWIPWLAAAALAAPGIRKLVAEASLFGGLLVLLGEPSYMLMGGLSFFVVFLQRPVSRRRLAAAASSAVLAAAIGAATLLPGTALARRSRRAQAPGSYATAKSFPPARAAEILLPGATGDMLDRRGVPFFAGALGSGAASGSYYYGLYGGVLLPILSLAPLFWRRRRRIVLSWGGLVLATFLLSLGGVGGLWPALRSLVPPLRLLRYPEKFVSLALFGMTALAAGGLDVLRRETRRRGLPVAALSAGAAGVLLALRPAASAEIARRLHASILTGIPAARIASYFRSTLLWGAFRYAAMAALLFALATAARRYRPALLLLLLAAGAADSWLFSRRFAATYPSRWFEGPPPALARLARAPEPPRLVDMLPLAPPGTASGPPHLPSGDELKARAPFLAPVLWGVPLALNADFDDTATLSSDRARDLALGVAGLGPSKFAQLLAARHDCALLAWRGTAPASGPVVALATPNCRPEIDPALEVLRFSGDADFVARIAEHRGDLSRVALTETPLPPLTRNLADARIERVHSSSSRIAFSSTATGPTLIRIARTNDGYWRARVDGRPQPIFSIDVSLMGVLLAPGTHRVELRYRDPFVTAGIAISLAGVLAWLGLATLGPGRSRSRKT